MRWLAMMLLLLTGCAVVPPGGEQTGSETLPAWVADQFEGVGLHTHPHGSSVWIGHEVEALLDGLGEPDFMLLTPMEDVAYCYRRTEPDAQGRVCIDAYVVDEYEMVVAVYCRD